MSGCVRWSRINFASCGVGRLSSVISSIASVEICVCNP